MTSGILLVHLLFLTFVCFLDCFSRNFASFIAALRALSSFLCFSSSSLSCFFNSLFSFALFLATLVNIHTFPIVTFFFGLFATGILSSSDRGDYCAATELLFDTSDAVGVFSDSDSGLSAEPDDDILLNNEGIC